MVGHGRVGRSRHLSCGHHFGRICTCDEGVALASFVRIVRIFSTVTAGSMTKQGGRVQGHTSGSVSARGTGCAVGTGMVVIVQVILGVS